jgi:hypothetical protein
MWSEGVSGSSSVSSDDMFARRSWKVAGFIVSALVTLLTLPPAPAPAHEPMDQQQLNPTHFNGNDRCGRHPNCEFVTGQTNEAQIASDRFDGVDSLYSMRALATPEALYYDWYHCEGEGTPYTPGACTLIARDTTPTLSQPASGIAQVAAFDATFDIPSNIQFGRTFRALACIDGPPVTEAHCFADRTGVHFDDASNTADHAPTDNGQITQPAHGGAVSNAGFTAVAFTSESDIGRILFCLDIGTSATRSETASPGQGCDPGSASDLAPDDSASCGQVPAGADCWSVSIDPPDNNEFSLGIVEQDDPTAPVSSGSGDCEGDTQVGGDGANTGDDCQLDKIYVTSKDLPVGPPAPPPPPPPAPPPPSPARCPGFQSDSRAQFVGSAGNDVLEGTSGRDIICGLGGNDTIRGLGRGDVLIGGAGSDVLIGGRGNDIVRGGRGRDIVRGGRGRDIVRGGRGRDTLLGGRSADTLLGGRGNDVLRGGPGRDVLDGGRGRDRCRGSRGNDVLRRCER